MQLIMNGFWAVSRAKNAKHRVIPQKELKIEISSAHRHGMIWNPLTNGSIDETNYWFGCHFITNVDNGRTLKFGERTKVK